MDVEESISDTVVPGMPVTTRLERLKNSLKYIFVVSEEMKKSVNSVFAVTVRVIESETVAEYVLSMMIPLSSRRLNIKFGSLMPLT